MSQFYTQSNFRFINEGFKKECIILFLFHLLQMVEGEASQLLIRLSPCRLVGQLVWQSVGAVSPILTKRTESLPADLEKYASGKFGNRNKKIENSLRKLILDVKCLRNDPMDTNSWNHHVQNAKNMM